MTTRQKSRQYCSVCKEWLEMEVVPTGDGEDDDGVIWFRCPQCQGFLPKLSGADLQPSESDGQDGEKAGDDPKPDPTPDSTTDSTKSSPSGMPWDSPADMMAAREKDGDESVLPDLEEMAADAELEAKVAPAAKSAGASDKPSEPTEPILEYAAMLAEKDVDDPTPYRPWETYEVGQCILHQAWEDCGVVVAKEKLPGGRQVIKCYFEEAGVVRLIEQAPR